jgi:hypothetical protein
MSIWQHYSKDEKLVMLQQTAEAKRIVEQAVEKDWWVNAILAALTKTSWADYLQFKIISLLTGKKSHQKSLSRNVDACVCRHYA